MKDFKNKYSAIAIFGLMLVVGIIMIGYSRKQQDKVYVTDIQYGDLLVDEAGGDGSTSSDENKVRYTCGSIEESGQMLRKGLKNRKTTIEIVYTGTVSDYNSMSKQIHDLAFSHTGVGDEGDYLNWNHTKVTRKYTKGSQIFTYVLTYLDSASKEKETTSAIKKVESKLSISESASDYDKIKTIYDYLAKHIQYDYNDTSDLPYTAYDAIVNGKAVCQGYATLFYRILLDYGIENRIVVSTTHAWNLVKVGSKYYECDLTWDSQGVQKGQSYKYFLKAKIDDSTHKWRTDAISDDVQKLARASSDYKSTSSSSGTPAAPTLELSQSGNSVTLKWNAVDGATSYEVYRKAAGGSWKKLSTTDKTSYNDKNLKKGSYSYRIKSCSSSGKGKYSTAKKVKITK